MNSTTSISRKRTIGHTLKLAIAVTVGAIAIPRQVLGDGFVVPVFNKPGDDRPFVSLQIKTGATTTTFNALVDTGASGGNLKVDTGSDLAGAVTGGTDTKFRGVGGLVDGKTDGSIPAGSNLMFAGPVVAAPGNTNTTPTLPTKADVIPLPRPKEATIGNGWIKANFAVSSFVSGPGGDYWVLVTKAEANTQAQKDAISTGNHLANPGVALRGDARPVGTLNETATAVVDSTFPGGNIDYDSGYTIPILASNGGTNTSSPFLLKQGFSQTLISQSLATSPGLSVSPGTAAGDLGAVTVGTATLNLRLINDPTFPVENVTVGVLASADNPDGLSFLGNDVLGALPYWEIDPGSSDSSPGTFYAVPEPGAISMLLASGLLLMTRRVRSKR